MFRKSNKPIAVNAEEIQALLESNMFCVSCALHVVYAKYTLLSQKLSRETLKPQVLSTAGWLICPDLVGTLK